MFEEMVRDGFVRVEGALDPEFCEDVAADAFARIGCDDDPATWPDRVEHLPVVHNWGLAAVAPRAAEAVEALVGGADAIRFVGVQDNLIVNFPSRRRWWPPAEWDAEGAGWHKDGDWFRHFLDSPEQGLLVIVFWRDVVDRQGPTYVAVDSVAPMARLLAAAPQGYDPAELREPIRRVLAGCRDFRALTGRQGDIVLAHPFLLHTASVNALDRPRVISNTSVMLRRPMRFDGAEGHPTVVERTILAGLGVQRLDYRPTGERRAVDSERARRWRAEQRSASPG